MQNDDMFPLKCLIIGSHDIRGILNNDYTSKICKSLMGYGIGICDIFFVTNLIEYIVQYRRILVDLFNSYSRKLIYEV